MRGEPEQRIYIRANNHPDRVMTQCALPDHRIAQCQDCGPRSRGGTEPRGGGAEGDRDRASPLVSDGFRQAPGRAPWRVAQRNALRDGPSRGGLLPDRLSCRGFISLTVALLTQETLAREPRAHQG